MKEKTSWTAHVSMIRSMNGVGNLPLGNSKFNSWKSVHTWMVPYFLLIGTWLETHMVYTMGYMKPTLRSFSISTLTVGACERWMGLLFWQVCATSDHVSIWCSMIDGSISGVLVNDQAKISWNSWKSALYETTSSRDQDAPSVIYSTT